MGLEKNLTFVVNSTTNILPLWGFESAIDGFDLDILSSNPFTFYRSPFTVFPLMIHSREATIIDFPKRIISIIYVSIKVIIARHIAVKNT